MDFLIKSDVSGGTGAAGVAGVLKDMTSNSECQSVGLSFIWDSTPTQLDFSSSSSQI